ncbi:Transient receptor potential cation channel subfamily A member 1, partial [Paramuricea clavata]
MYPNDPKYSAEFRGTCARVHDDTKLFVEMTNADDLANVTSCKFPENPYCQYEKERLSHLMIRLESSLSLCGRFNLNEAELKLLATAMIPIKLTDIIDTAKALRDNFPSEAHQVQPKYDALLKKCHSLLEGIAELTFPPVKPRWADFTDAGPGVACNSFEVQFRDAELAIIHNSDYRIRLHSSRGNSSDNEAERTNSAIGDSIVDGATLQWNKHKRFDGLSDEDISKLTVKEFEEHETDRMEKNAWYCANEIRNRVDGAPVFNEFIKCYLTPKQSPFFFNKKYLKQFQSCTAAESKQQVPGYHYITNVLNFIERHYRIGELYMEYIRDGCRENGEVCKKCSEKDWVGPRFSRVPAPYPDPDKPGHYMSVFNTPTTDNNGQLREVDDVAPRAVIKRLYKAGTISSDNVEQLKEVSSRYCVEEKDVASYVKHLEELKMMSAIRENERRKKREKECSKTYEDYDWNTLIDSGKLNSLK